MKKQLLLLNLLLGIFSGPFVIAQCVPDPNITQPGIYPDSATGLASGIVGQPYNQVMQIKVPVDTQVVYLGFTLTATIQSIQLMSFTGLPPGITYACNPANCIFPGGSNACVLLSGTPNTAGVFNPVAIVKTTGTVVLFGQTITLTQNDTIDYYTIVIGVSGLPEINPDLLNLGQNHPNPAVFKTHIDFYVPEGGEYFFRLFNLLGKEVQSQKLDLSKGIHTLEIDVSQLMSGIYVYSLSGKQGTLTRRMTVQQK
jgi:hypothetical protein